MNQREKFLKPVENQEKCVKALEYFLWGKRRRFRPTWVRPTCPRCSKADARILDRGRSLKWYQCKKCRKQFTVFSGTKFSRTKIALPIWFEAFWYFRRSEPMKRIALDLGVDRNTVRRLRERFRELDKFYSKKDFLSKVREKYARHLVRHPQDDQ